MDAIKKYLPSLLPIIGGIVGFATSGPLGAIVSLVAVGGLLVAGVMIYNKYKNWLFDKAQQEAISKAVEDQAAVIAANQKQADADAAALNASKLEKEKALQPQG